MYPEPILTKPRPLWHITVAVALGIIIAVVVLCGGYYLVVQVFWAGTVVSVTQSDIPSREIPTPPTGKIGERIEGNGLAITVDGLTTRPPNVSEQVESGNEVVVIQVTLENITPDNENKGSGFYFRLRGEDGTQFRQLNGFDQRLAGSLNGGDRLSGELKFQVPPAVKSFWLLYNFSSGTEQLKYPRFHLTR